LKRAPPHTTLWLSKKTPNQTNIMPFDTVNMEEITKARRKAIAESIRTISTEELKALGEKVFPGVDQREPRRHVPSRDDAR
jgi:hypothetical protein